MNRRKITQVTVMATAFVLLGAVSASAQTTRQEIIFGNGLGAEITELVVSPSKDQYANNRNRFAQALQVNDRGFFSAALPDHLLRFDCFDIEVSAGGKRYATRYGVKLDREKGTPVLELSEAGKDSTLGLKVGLSTVAGTIAFLGGTPAGRRLLVRTLFSLRGWKGIVTILSLPTAAGAAGYAVGNSLAPVGLNVQVAYIK